MMVIITRRYKVVLFYLFVIGFSMNSKARSFYSLRKMASILAASLAGLFLMTNSALAQSAPVQFEADRVETNQDTGSLIATGNVILIQDGNELRADRVDYNRQTQSASASGHVIYKTQDGAIHMSDTLDLDENFTKIFAEPLISEIAGGGRFTAATASGDVETEIKMDSTSFTPCECDFENGESPIWDLRATKSTHDKVTKTIIHENVRMHILGLPVFYMPVLAHPDGSVERRTGFLAPSVQYSSAEGLNTSIPYYKTLGPSADVEVRPHLFQHRGQALHTIYRQKTDDADVKVNLYTANVATFKKDRENVAAIDATYETEIGDDWQVKAQIQRSSQDTFLRRYGFRSSYDLNSKVKAERIKDDRYYLVEASDYQGLRKNDTPDKEPSILPYIYYEKYQDGFRDGQIMRTELSALQLDNDESHEMVRWSGDVGLYEEYQILDSTFETEFGIMASAYDIQNNAGTDKHDGELGQVNPYASFDWRAPLAVYTDTQFVMIEPRFKLTHIAGADRTDEIPNRDASDFRLDENNLFMTQRHQGKDYVLPGTRADIGVSALAENSILGDVTAFAGLSRRLAGKTAAGLTTGNNRNYSDYVASVTIKPDDSLSLSWSGRADSQDFELNESRTTVNWKYRDTTIDIEHASLAKAHFTSPTDDREQLSASIQQEFGDGWIGKAIQSWDLSKGKTRRDDTRFTLAWTGGFQDCLTLSLDYQRDSTSDRDIPRKDEIFLVLNFKYLGAISQRDFTKD